MSSMEPTPSVAALREARKRAELDAQMLANRIALLRQEGEKACKRLFETRMRTREMEEARREKGAGHEAVLMSRLQDIHMKQKANQLARQQGRAVMQDIQAALLATRRRNAQQVREEGRQLQESKKVTDAMQRQLLTERVVALKERTVGEEKRRMVEEARLMHLARMREEHQNRGAAEAALRMRTERRIAELEREEVELVEWLKAKQLEQRVANEELAAVAERHKPVSIGASTHS